MVLPMILTIMLLEMSVNVSVAGKQAVRYEYEDGNGNLLKVCYGNGAYIRYEYDKQNRIHMVYFKDAADSKDRIFTDMLMINREIFMR